jgi:3,4-dihydroxy 2-butanone 4-phosphate synthase/GTP cyclohydrolase II
MVEEEGRGIIVSMNQEGRGIGLVNKLMAYKLQEQGMDTVEANIALGFDMDERDYGIGASILVDLGLRTIRLLTNNPVKRAALGGFGLIVRDRVALEVAPNERNAAYLTTKMERFGHELTDDADAPVSTGVGDIATQGSIGAPRVRRAERRGVAMAPPDGAPTAAGRPRPSGA